MSEQQKKTKRSWDGYAGNLLVVLTFLLGFVPLIVGNEAIINETVWKGLSQYLIPILVIGVIGIFLVILWFSAPRWENEDGEPLLLVFATITMALELSFVILALAGLRWGIAILIALLSLLLYIKMRKS